MKAQYRAWISTAGEKDWMKMGALFAGLVRDVPDQYRHVLNKRETRQYVVIWPDETDNPPAA